VPTIKIKDLGNCL